MGLNARGVAAGYGGAPIIEGMDIEAKPGELVGVLGPNAAGKTTLLRALAGALPLASGEVLLDGASVAQLAPRVAKVHTHLAQAYQALGRADDAAREFEKAKLVTSDK